jgi:hypothetical protein
MGAHSDFNIVEVDQEAALSQMPIRGHILVAKVGIAVTPARCNSSVIKAQ